MKMIQILDFCQCGQIQGVWSESSWVYPTHSPSTTGNQLIHSLLVVENNILRGLQDYYSFEETTNTRPTTAEATSRGKVVSGSKNWGTRINASAPSTPRNNLSTIH